MANNEGTPLHGDRSAWNTTDHAGEHARDVDGSALQRHLPLPGAARGLVQSDGTDWQRVDQIEHQDLSDKDTFIDIPLSPMLLTGGDLSAGTNAGTIKVAALTALLRTTDSTTGSLEKITLAEQDNKAMGAANTTYYVVLDYNDNNPQILIQVAAADAKRQINVGQCIKETDHTVHYTFGGFSFAQGIQKAHIRAQKLRAWEMCQDIVIADEGTKHFSIAAGCFFRGINKFTWTTFDTSVVSTFTSVYYDGDLGTPAWVYTDNQTTIDVDNYNNVATGLAACNKYMCHWVFVHPDDGHVYVVYGQDNGTIGAISDSTVPSVPDLIDIFGMLIGRIIIDGGVAAFHRIEMVNVVAFTPSVVVEHNELSSIQGGTTAEYYHLTSSEHTELHGWLDNVTLGSSGELTLEGNQIIDVTSAEALLVRKNADSGDVFVVDTTNAVAGFGGNVANHKLDVIHVSNTANEIALYCLMSGTVTGNNYALYFNQTSVCSGAAMGIFASATGAGAGTNYALYANASGASINYGLYVAGGDAWFVGNVSALSFTDRTPFYKGDALKEIAKIKGKDGQIDHASLPDFVKVPKKKNVALKKMTVIEDEKSEPVIYRKGEQVHTLDEKQQKGIDYEEVDVIERDLGAMVSVLTVAVQQLARKVELLS